MAALVIGGAALAVAVLERRPRPGRRSLPLAGAAFFGTWLVIGVALLSHMQRMQPRYLDAVVPAIAAVVGIGIGALAGAPRRVPRLALATAAAGVAVIGVLLAHPPGWLAVLALGAAAGGALAVFAVSDRRRAAVLALCAVARRPRRARRGRRHGRRAAPLRRRPAEPHDRGRGRPAERVPRPPPGRRPLRGRESHRRAGRAAHRPRRAPRPDAHQPRRPPPALSREAGRARVRRSGALRAAGTSAPARRPRDGPAPPPWHGRWATPTT